jgi:hypothetical protein
LTLIAAILDEAAFFPADETSANPDSEILNAVRPGLSTTNGMLVVASSPYARRGELWNTYRRHYGPNGDPKILVAKGASRDFNPSLPQSVVDRALERDPASARAEYLAEFRTDVETFVSPEVVAACVDNGVYERLPLEGVRYHAFCDPSGGSADSMTLAITHRERDETVVLDAVREVKPPFSPESVVAEFASLLKSYRIGTVRGDRYAGEWPRERFRKCGIEYRPGDKTKSELYLDLLPMINSGRVVLLDHLKLVNQLCGLERRTARGGRDSIDHAPNQHDDIANAVAGAVYLALSRRSGLGFVLPSAPLEGFVGKVFVEGREVTTSSGLQHIDHEFPDYGGRIWESGLTR